MLSGTWQRIAQLAWLVVAVLDVFILVVGIPLLFAAAMAPTASTHLDRDALGLTQAMRLAWQSSGLPDDAYGYIIVLTRLAFVSSFLVVSAIMIWRRPDHIVAIIISFFLLTFAIFNALPQSLLIQRAPLAYAASELIQTVASVLILPVLYLFPNGRFVTRWSKWVLVPWGVLHLAWLLIPNLPFNVIYGDTWERTFVLSLLFSEAWYASGFAIMLYRYRRLATATERQQMRWVVITWCVGFLASIVYIAVPASLHQAGASLDGGPRLVWNIGFYSLMGLIFSLGAIAFAIAILRHRLWDVDRLFGRAARYLLASVIAVIAICALLEFLIASTINLFGGPSNTLTLGLYAVTAALLFNPIRRHLQSLIDRKFDRTRIDAAQAITSFARDARNMIALPDLLSLLMTRAVGLYQASSAAIVLSHENQILSQPLSLARTFNLPPSGPAELLGLIARAPAVHTQHADFPLLLPLTTLRQGSQTQIGYLALGPRLSEQAYSRHDVDLLRSLAEQAGAAIAVAQLVEVQRQIERHRHTPAGQAEQLVSDWLGHPHQILHRLHTLSEQAFTDSYTYATLDRLPGAAMQANAPALRLLVEGYCRLLDSRSDETMLSLGLRQIIAALSHPQAAAWSGAAAALAFHRLLLQQLTVYSLEHIADAQTALAQAASTPGTRVKGDLFERVEPALAHHQNLVYGLHHLIPVAEALAKSGRSAVAQDKLCYLEEAHDRLLALTLQPMTHPNGLAAIDAGATDAGAIDSLVFGRIRQTWQTVVEQAIQALLGQAELKLVLQTRHVIHAEHLSAEHLSAEHLRIGIEVVNEGLSVAEEVCLELLPSPAYQLIESWEVLPAIAPGCAASATFVICIRDDFARSDGTLLPLHLRLNYADWQARHHQREINLQAQVLRLPRFRQPVLNPYCAGPPLSANSRVFMGREEDLAFVARALSQNHNHFMLIGPRRMGKTSMLKQLGAQLGEPCLPVFLDGQRLGIESGMAGFFYDVVCEIASALDMALPEFESFAAQPAHVFETVFLPQALQVLGQRRLLVLFDEFEELETRVLAGRLDEAVFAWLRHLMQHHPQLAFVFAGVHEPGTLRAQYWSPAMNNVLTWRVGHLSSASTRLLITQPTAGHLFYDDLALDQLQRLVAGHPFFTQLFCHTLVDQANQQQRNFVLAEHVELALPRVLEMGAGQLEDIWRDCTDEEQAVLLALAQNPGAAEVGRRHPDAIQRLVERELLAAKPGASAEPVWGWRLGLFQIWRNRAPLRNRPFGEPMPSLAQTDSQSRVHSG